MGGAGGGAFGRMGGGEGVDEFVCAAEVARVRVTAVAGDILEREVRATHELVGLFDAEAAEGGLRAHVADLREEAAEVGV